MGLFGGNKELNENAGFVRAQIDCANNQCDWRGDGDVPRKGHQISDKTSRILRRHHAETQKPDGMFGHNLFDTISDEGVEGVIIIGGGVERYTPGTIATEYEKNYH